MLDNNNIKGLDEEITENNDYNANKAKNKKINKASRFSQFLPAISSKSIFNKFDFKQTMFNNNIISIKLSKTKSILLPLNNLSLKKNRARQKIFL